MSIYRQWGVEPIINACGTVTRLGGAPMPSAVLAAIEEAARSAVSLEDLQAAASRKIAEAAGAEAGLVTSGAAAGLTLGTAAILAGHDLARIDQLPNSQSFPNEMIIAREQRSGYDHALRSAGAKLVEVGFNEIVAGAGVRRTELWEYEAAICERTAGIVYVLSEMSCPGLEDVVALAHKHSLPVLVDAAGELPPRDNLKAIPATGADLVAFSGGKAIRGPQATGILCGRKQLISSAALQLLDQDDHFDLWDPPEDLIDRSSLKGHPRHGIGRAHKVSKEAIAGLLTALDLFISGRYDAEIPMQHERLKIIAGGLQDASLRTEVCPSPDGERSPRLEIRPNDCQPASAFALCRALRKGRPPIYAGHSKLHEGILAIDPLCLSDEDAQTIVRRIREELSRLEP